MRLGALLRSAASAYPDGLARFSAYYDFTRGRVRAGTGDMLARFIVCELAETYAASGSAREKLTAAAERLGTAVRQLTTVVEHLRAAARTAPGADVVHADFSRRRNEED